MYKLHIDKFMYEYTRIILPNSFSNMFEYNHQIHSHNTRQRNQPHIHYKLELCAFALKGEHNVYSLVPNIAVCMYIYIDTKFSYDNNVCIFLYSVNIGNSQVA